MLVLSLSVNIAEVGDVSKSDKSLISNSSDSRELSHERRGQGYRSNWPRVSTVNPS